MRDDPARDDDPEFTRWQIIEAKRHYVMLAERASALRFEIMAAAGALVDLLGAIAPRSLREFTTHLQPHGDERKALELRPTAQVDLGEHLARPAAAPPAADPKPPEPGALSRPQFAQAAVIAYLSDKADATPTAGQIGEAVGIDAQTIRNTPAWKAYRRTTKRVAADVGGAADLGDVDPSLESLTGRQERGRDRRNLRHG